MLFDHNYLKYPELTNRELQTMGLSSPHPQITEDFVALVVKVHDGDTITLSTDFRDFNFPMRLLQIDAPEMNAGGDIARDWLKARIEGESVMIGIDPRQRVGKYGRLLGRVLHNGQDLGEEEIRLGLAKPFDRRQEGQIPNPHKTFDLKQWL